MRKDTSNLSGGKPAKPHADFPLFAHLTGRWAKKVRGKLCYFGPWRDPGAALAKWLAEKDYLLAGRRPPETLDGPTVRDLCNRFLTTKQHLVDTLELSARSFADYHRVCDRVIQAMGKDRRLDDVMPADFEDLRASLSKTLGPVALGNEIQRVRVLFKYAYDAALLDRPIRYGSAFKRPSRKVLRQERHSKGPRMFEPADLRLLLDAAGTQLRAMMLLALNAGYGNSDVGTLPMHSVDLVGCWLSYPRPKTAVPRRAPLWPESILAIRDVIACRPKHKRDVDAGLLFVTKYGQSWAKGTSTNPVSAEFRKILLKLGLHRSGLGFYSLRHVFQTIGDEAGDPVATSYIMGHADASMAGVYRERISDKRLVAVTDHVREWLFGKPTKRAK
ncbi:MAG: tyrosine-type recombinase/integrase [Planctomycetia bacterium]|nr:tyrosine-type recombinase/integrase [Planctomycetia bacterium]